ncbi:MAG: DUF748 domain-containing protein [Thermodesulfobacteriota bacterium]
MTILADILSHRFWRRAIMASLFLLLFYTILGFWLVPKLIQQRLRQDLNFHLQRPAEVGQVSLNPFSLRLTISQVKVMEADGQGEWLSFSELWADMALFPSLVNRIVVLQGLKISDPHFLLVLEDDNSLNISDLSRLLTDRVIMERLERLSAMRLHNLQVTGGEFTFVDKAVGSTSKASKVAISLPFLSAQPDDADISITPRFSAIINDVPLVMEAKSKPFSQSRETGISLSFTDLDLTSFQPYLALFSAINLKQGRLALDLNIAFAVKGEQPDLVISGRTRLDEISLNGPGSEQLLSAQAVEVEIARLDLFARRCQLKQITLDAPNLHLVRQADRTFNFNDLIAHPPPPQKSNHDPAEAKANSGKELPESSSPPQLSIAKISVNQGKLTLTDETKKPAAGQVIEGLTVRIENFNSGSSPSRVDISAQINNDGHLELSGTQSSKPLAADLELALSLPLGPLQPYLFPRRNIVAARGQAGLSGKLALKPGGKNKNLQISFQGQADLNDLRLDNNKGAKILKVGGVKAEQVSASYPELALAMGQVEIQRPSLYLTIDKSGKTNLAALGEEGPKKKKEKKKKSGPEPGAKLTAGEITVDKGQIHFQDNSLVMPMEMKFHDINGQISQLMADKASKFALKAVLDNHSTFTSQGRLNPFPAQRSFDFNLKIKDLDLSRFSPYSATYVGHKVHTGKLFLNQNNKLHRGRVRVDNDIFIDQLRLGERVKSKKAKELPLRLAIGLLKDVRGEIHLHVPVEGSLDDPEFRVDYAILQALVNIVMKASTTPFNLLGSLIALSEEDQYVTFAPASSVITRKKEAPLKKIAHVLENRPILKLEIMGQADTSSDRQAIADQRLLRLLEKEKRKVLARESGRGKGPDKVTISKKEFSTYLARAYGAAKFKRPRNALGGLEEQDEREMERLLRENIEVSELDLQHLARARAQAVADHLKENMGIDAHRLMVLEPEKSKPGQARRVTVTLR